LSNQAGFPNLPDSWLNVYWVLAALSTLSFLLLWSTPFKEKSNTEVVHEKTDFTQMFKLMAKLIVIVFVISAFLFLMIEQGIMTWLPTFNKEVIKLSTNISIMMASILAISLCLGRLIAGLLTQYVKPIYILSLCIIAAMAQVIFVLPQTASLVAVNEEIATFNSIPKIALAFPLVGLFISPIYPLLN
jgi:fucose permease